MRVVTRYAAKAVVTHAFAGVKVTQPVTCANGVLLHAPNVNIMKLTCHTLLRVNQ